MQRPGPPRRTSDWKKQSFNPPPGKGNSPGSKGASGSAPQETPAGAALTGKEIFEQMKTVPAWTQQGLEIKRKFYFEDFTGSMAFVNKVAQFAQAANHHPEIRIQWNQVSLTLTTHSEKGLTSKDFQLASQIDGLAG